MSANGERRSFEQAVKPQLWMGTRLTRNPWLGTLDSMDKQIVIVSRPSDAAAERTMLLGYMVGVPAGYLVVLTIQFLWSGYSSTNSMTAELTALMAPLMVLLLYVVSAIPFIVVRKLSGPGCFASPG